MKNNTVRLTEAQLHKVIKESVKRVIREMKSSTYLDAADKAYSDIYDSHSSLPKGKKEIRKQQRKALRDFGLKKDREERNLSDEDWNNYQNGKFDGMSRKTLKACDAHNKVTYGKRH